MWKSEGLTSRGESCFALCSSTHDARFDLNGVEKPVLAFSKMKHQIIYVGSPPYEKEPFPGGQDLCNTFEPAACWTMTNEARKDAGTSLTKPLNSPWRFDDYLNGLNSRSSTCRA